LSKPRKKELIVEKSEEKRTKRVLGRGDKSGGCLQKKQRFEKLTNNPHRQGENHRKKWENQVERFGEKKEMTSWAH